MDSKIERLTISTCADLLEQNSRVHVLSVGITLAAILSVLMLAIIDIPSLTFLLLLLLVIALGVAETFMSVRTGFDAALLRQLAETNTNNSEGLVQLDAALVKLGLLPTDKTGRELGVRLQACMRLFRLQVILCVCQIIAIACFGITLVL